MDSAGDYFTDSCLGPGSSSDIQRRNSQGVAVTHRVPPLIEEYNKYISGVDVVDQIKKDVGVDTLHATKKYTVRMFEVLWSMVLSQ